GRLPAMSNDYFARLGYGDLDSATSLSPHVTSRQLAWVRVLGMLAFLAVGYARHPGRILRTLRALVTERSTSVVELRLVEVKRRLVSWLRRRHVDAPERTSDVGPVAEPLVDKPPLRVDEPRIRGAA